MTGVDSIRKFSKLTQRNTTLWVYSTLGTIDVSSPLRNSFQGNVEFKGKFILEDGGPQEGLTHQKTRTESGHFGTNLLSKVIQV